MHTFSGSYQYLSCQYLFFNICTFPIRGHRYLFGHISVPIEKLRTFLMIGFLDRNSIERKGTHWYLLCTYIEGSKPFWYLYAKNSVPFGLCTFSETFYVPIAFTVYFITSSVTSVPLI